MSKLLLGSAICFVVAGGSAATAYGFGAFGSGKKASPESLEKTNNNTFSKLPLSIDELNTFAGDRCITKHFPGLDMGTLTVPSYDMEAMTIMVPDGNKKPINACIASDWNRNEYSDGREWNGGFRWLSVIVKEGKGLVSFNILNKGSTAKDLEYLTVSYVVAKGDDGNWRIEIPTDELSGIIGDGAFDMRSGKPVESNKRIEIPVSDNGAIPTVKESSKVWDWRYTTSEEFQIGAEESDREIEVWSNGTISRKDLGAPKDMMGKIEKGIINAEIFGKQN